MTICPRCLVRIESGRKRFAPVSGISLIFRSHRKGSKLGSPISDEKEDVPFEIRFALGGAYGGLDEPEKIGIDSVWFGNKEEFMEYISSRSKTLVDGLKLQFSDFVPMKSRR